MITDNTNFYSTQSPLCCSICNKAIEGYEAMPVIWSPEHDGYICYVCYKKTYENPEPKGVQNG